MTRDVGLRELVESLSHLSDEEAFRWHQETRGMDAAGVPVAGDTLRVTMGRIREELGLARRDR